MKYGYGTRDRSAVTQDRRRRVRVFTIYYYYYYYLTRAPPLQSGDRIAQRFHVAVVDRVALYNFFIIIPV